MAGGWHHIVLEESGKLLVNEDAVQMLENGGDWYEFAEEVYGMIWFLAMQLTGHDKAAALEWIAEAERSHKRGLAISPGVDGRLNPYFIEKGDDDYSQQFFRE